MDVSTERDRGVEWVRVNGLDTRILQTTHTVHMYIHICMHVLLASCLKRGLFLSVGNYHALENTVTKPPT